MKRILVVDDDRASCDVLREIFAAQGWQVETTQSPEQALKLATNEKFHLIVSDINLEAKMSGLDLLKQPWAREHGKYIAYFLPPGTPSGLFGDELPHLHGN